MALAGEPGQAQQRLAGRALELALLKALAHWARVEQLPQQQPPERLVRLAMLREQA
jgi:hypothetical protein